MTASNFKICVEHQLGTDDWRVTIWEQPARTEEPNKWRCILSSSVYALERWFEPRDRLRQVLRDLGTQQQRRSPTSPGGAEGESSVSS